MSKNKQCSPYIVISGKELEKEIWISINYMLSPKIQDDLGISPDRNITQVITRMCSAIIDGYYALGKEQ